MTSDLAQPAASALAGRRVLVGVGGGIAAYKAANLVRELQRAGATVRVVMTSGAQQFVTPLTFQALTGSPVGVSLFDPGFEHEIGHIELARWADALVIAPATANVIARLRAGMADDLLTTVVLATDAEVLVCPAMNTHMLHHPATQENLAALGARPRTSVLAPDAGALACGEVGAGRLPDAPVIVRAAAALLSSGSGALSGRHVCVSAGPTREHFDHARYLSNPSSGRMGFALAEAARAAGATVTLVAGPTNLSTPPGCARVDVVSAAELSDAVHAHADDIVIMAAAVADWRPAEPVDGKREKCDGEWSPRMVRTEDIIATLAASSARPRCLVGFAAEADDVVARADAKRARKGLDAIVANKIGPGGAFGSASNHVWMLREGATPVEVGRAPKGEVAARIISWVASWACEEAR